MTDEEMAEESLISYRKEPKWEGKIFMQDENTSYKDGFFAGLKAGKPKWHKVADGDLPEYRYYVLVSRGTRTDKALYNKYEEKWYSYYDDDELDNVTAWCEIPKYEVENDSKRIEKDY